MDLQDSQLDALLAHVEHDPANPMLLIDAADAALANRRPDLARDLLGKVAALISPTPRLLHLEALAALQEQRFRDAVAILDPLLAAGNDHPGVRFNLAWALANTSDGARALATIDEATAASLPQAAALKLQLLHDQGDLDSATAFGEAALSRFPGHAALLAAASVLAVDKEDVPRARDLAIKAGEHPDALSTLGTLALNDGEITMADALFDRALAIAPDNPRARIGRGLVNFLTNKPAHALEDLDRGAERFGRHLGSWITAGWAHFNAGDRATARARFETALAIDPTFAESHGSLAVLEVLDGNVDTARERSRTARRLDRQCASAALAEALLAAGDGDPDRSRLIVQAALSAQLGQGTDTLGDALVRLGFGQKAR